MLRTTEPVVIQIRGPVPPDCKELVQGTARLHGLTADEVLRVPEGVAITLSSPSHDLQAFTAALDAVLSDLAKALKGAEADRPLAGTEPNELRFPEAVVAPLLDRQIMNGEGLREIVSMADALPEYQFWCEHTSALLRRAFTADDPVRRYVGFAYEDANYASLYHQQQALHAALEAQIRYLRSLRGALPIYVPAEKPAAADTAQNRKAPHSLLAEVRDLARHLLATLPDSGKQAGPWLNEFDSLNAACFPANAPREELTAAVPITQLGRLVECMDWLFRQPTPRTRRWKDNWHDNVQERLARFLELLEEGQRHGDGQVLAAPSSAALLNEDIMETERWWSRPGETIWRGASGGASWEVNLEKDDGANWVLSLRTRSGEDIGEHTARWDYRSNSFVSPVHLGVPVDLVEELTQQLRAAGPFPDGPLSTLHRRALDEAAGAVLQSDRISGRKIRASLIPAPGEKVDAVLDDLVPRYLSRAGKTPGDLYFPTLAGLLESPHAGRAALLVEGVLSLLRRKFRENPDFCTYDWKDLSQVSTAKGIDLPFARSIIIVANLANGGCGSQDSHEWRVPHDIEKLVRCEDFGMYEAYLRSGASTSAWPSAPVRSMKAIPETLQMEPDDFVEVLEYDVGAPGSTLVDADVLEALERIGPAVAACYRQALSDFADPCRESFVGPACELREVFSIVIHECAPDEAVMAETGFKAETRDGRPTRRQRIRHILRNSGESDRDVAAKADERLEEIAGIAGPIYARMSKSTHRPDQDRGKLRTLLAYWHGLLRDILLADGG